MRLDPFPRFPSDDAQMVRKLTDLFREVALQVNGLTEGRIGSVTNAYTSAPTTGTWKQGDFIRNSAPVEAGVALSKYVVTGWLRVTTGSGNVLNTDWLACRSLTGN